MPQPTLLVNDAAGDPQTVFTLNPNGQAAEAGSQPMVLPQTQVDALVSGRATESTLATVAINAAKVAANTAGKATEVTQSAIKSVLDTIAVSLAATASAGAGAATEGTLSAAAASLSRIAANSSAVATETTLADVAASAAKTAANTAGKATEATQALAKVRLDEIAASAATSATNSAGKATEATLLSISANTARSVAQGLTFATEATLATLAASASASATNSVGKATEATLRTAAQALIDIAASVAALATASADKEAEATLSDIAASSSAIAARCTLAATEETLTAAKFALGVIATHAAKAAANSARSATEETLAAAANKLAIIAGSTAAAATEVTQLAIKSTLTAVAASVGVTATNSASAASEATVSALAASAAVSATNSAAAATEATLVDVKLALEALGVRATGSAPESRAVTTASAAGQAAYEVMSCQGAPGGTPLDTRITSSATARALGLVATTTGYGNLRVTAESTSLFADDTSLAELDTVDCWHVPETTGDMTLRQGAGTREFCTSTASGASVVLESRPSFAAAGGGFLDYGLAVKLEPRVAGLFALNQHRFWGFGDRPTDFCATNPLNNAAGFEIGANGQLCCVVYIDGVNRFRAAATLQKSALNTLFTPSTGFVRFGLVLRADSVLFYVGTTEYPAQIFAANTADFSPLPPMPLRTAIINGVSGTVGRSVFQVAAVSVGDTAANGMQIRDGAHPWRKAAVDEHGRLSVASACAVSPSYHYGQAGLAPIPESIVVAIEAGPAKSVEIKRLHIVSGTAAEASVVSLTVARLTSPGSSGAVTISPALNRNVGNPNFSGQVRASGATVGDSTATGLSFDVPTPATGSLPVVLSIDLTNGGTLEGFVIPAGQANGFMLIHPGIKGAAGFGIRLEWTEAG